MIERPPSRYGDVSRKDYIEQMHGVVEYAGRHELVGGVALDPSGWQYSGLETGRQFHSAAGDTRAEVFEITSRRIDEAIASSDDNSATKAETEMASSHGDVYKWTSALHEAKGELRWEIAAPMVDGAIMSGFPRSALDYLARATDQEPAEAEDHGYTLEWMEDVWTLAEHPDVGPQDRMLFARRVVADARGTEPFSQGQFRQLISRETWGNPEGLDAEKKWEQRYADLEYEIDGMYIAQVGYLDAGGEFGDDEFSMLRHELGNRVADRSRWEYRAEDGEAGSPQLSSVATGLATSLISFNAEFLRRFVESKGSFSDQNTARLRARELQELTGIAGLNEDGWGNTTEQLALMTNYMVGDETMRGLREAASGLLTQVNQYLEMPIGAEEETSSVDGRRGWFPLSRN